MTRRLLLDAACVVSALLGAAAMLGCGMCVNWPADYTLPVTDNDLGITDASVHVTDGLAITYRDAQDRVWIAEYAVTGFRPMNRGGDTADTGDSGDTGDTSDTGDTGR